MKRHWSPGQRRHGAAICRQLSTDGLHVIVHANSNPDRAYREVESIIRSGGSAETACFDITDADAPTRAQAILNEGPIQVLVNNAGIIHDDAPLAGWSRLSGGGWLMSHCTVLQCHSASPCCRCWLPAGAG